jgi:hypothetical protein
MDQQKKITKTIRPTTINSMSSYRQYGRTVSVPLLSVNGLWLKEAGFNDHDKCQIKVSRNKLVITKIKAVKNDDTSKKISTNK